MTRIALSFAKGIVLEPSAVPNLQSRTQPIKGVPKEKSMQCCQEKW